MMRCCWQQTLRRLLLRDGGLLDEQRGRNGQLGTCTSPKRVIDSGPRGKPVGSAVTEAGIRGGKPVGTEAGISQTEGARMGPRILTVMEGLRNQSLRHSVRVSSVTAFRVITKQGGDGGIQHHMCTQGRYLRSRTSLVVAVHCRHSIKRKHATTTHPLITISQRA
jgi:hypothetical protein